MVAQQDTYKYKDVKSTYLTPSGEEVNMYGIVTEWTMPRSTRGTGAFVCKLG